MDATQQQTGAEHPDEFEIVKEEPGYNDSDIRELVRNVKWGVEGIFESDESGRLKFLVDEREKRDWEILRGKSKKLNAYFEEVPSMQPYLGEYVQAILTTEKTALESAEGFFGDDRDKIEEFQKLTESVMNESGFIAVNALVKVLDVFDGDMAKLKRVSGIIMDLCGMQSATKNVECLVAVQNLYGNDVDKFKQVKDLLQTIRLSGTSSDRFMEALMQARDVYGDDISLFKDFVGLKDVEPDVVNSLVKAKSVCGNDVSMFRDFIEVGKKHSVFAVEALLEARAFCGDDFAMFREFTALGKLYGGYVIRELLNGRNLYEGDRIIFDLIVRFSKENKALHSWSFGNLIRAFRLFGKDYKTIEKFKLAIVECTRENFDLLLANKEHYIHDPRLLAGYQQIAVYKGSIAIEELSRIHETFRPDSSLLLRIVDVMTVPRNRSGFVYDFASMIADIKEDKQKCDIYTDCAKAGVYAVSALLEAKEVYGDVMERFEKVKDIIVEVAKAENGDDALKALAGAKEAYGSNMEKFMEVKAMVLKIAKKDNWEEVKKAYIAGDYTANGVLECLIEVNPDNDFFAGVTEQNSLFLLETYAGINEERFPGFEDVRSQIRDKVDENKDGIVLDRLVQLRDSALRDPAGIDGRVKASLKKIADDGLPHFRVLEATVDYVCMLIDEEFSVEERQLSDELIGKMAKYRAVENGIIKRSKKTADYKNTDLASFYEKSLMVHAGRPNLHVLALDCFNSMERDTKNYLLMQNGVMGRIATISALFPVISFDLKHRKSSEIEGLLVQMKKGFLADKNKETQKQTIFEAVEELNRIMIGIFSSLGLKNLSEITDKMTPYIVTYLTYLGNIHDSNEQKKDVLLLFMLLKILNKWDAFKRGEAIEVGQYLSDEIRGNVEKYLEERKNLDIFAGVASEENGEGWVEVMSSNTEILMLGESRGIVDVLDNINNSFHDLLDPDNFESNEEADRLLPVVKLFTDFAEECGIEEKTETLNNKLLPGRAVVEVFGKIGEKMTTDSGVIPVNEDIAYLEGVLHKNVDKLTEGEVLAGEQYIADVKGEVKVLYDLRDALERKYRETLKVVQNPGARFDERLQKFEKMFSPSSVDQAMHLKAVMTGDLVDVIPHIRQCLGCKTKECNNDTNLTFGDRNRFLVITRQAKMSDENSISDELVTVQRTLDEGVDEEGGNMGFSFVMDNVWGNRTRDVLVANVLAVIKKMQQLKKVSPSVVVDVFVTNSALSSCSVGIEYLAKKLNEEGYDLELEQVTKNVSIAKSAGGDGYYEIGGDFVRTPKAVDWKISGIKITG